MTAPNQTDASLVRAASTGDLVAFEQLIRRHQDGLFRQALGYLGCPADAQDVVQEALCRAFERFHSLRDPTKVTPWLRSLVRNGCLNGLRARRRRAEAESQADAPSPMVADNGALDQTAAHLLRSLPTASTTAFRLHYLEGRSLAAVAGALGATPSSVKQRLYRARKQLQQEAIAMAAADADRLPDEFPARVIAHLIESGHRDRLHMRYDEAREHFHQALEVQPDHPEALLEFGRSYSPLGWPDDRQFGALERAARAAPDSLEVACELAMACRQPGREDMLRAEHDRALGLSQHRLTDCPEDITTLKIRARLLILDGGFDETDGAFDEAERLLRRAVELDPTDHEACFWLARTLDHMDRRDEAQPLYARICERGGDTLWEFSAHRQRATHLAFRVGDIERAVEHMEEAWRLAGWANEAGNLIYFLGACERFERIRELYESTRQDHPRVHATAGIAYARTGSFEEAKAAWERVLESSDSDPVKAEASLHLARCLYELDRPEQAANHLEAGGRLDLADRPTLASGSSTPFHAVWTQWLVECLEALESRDADVAPLLEKARQQIGS